MDWLSEHVDLSALVTEAVKWLPKLGLALLIFLAFLIFSKLTRRFLSAALRRAGLHETLRELLVDKIYHYSLLILGLVMALDQMGVNVAAALAGLGVAGIAVGFAAQDTLANLIAGFVIFMDKPFLVNDWVTTGDSYGQVTTITLRTTRIRTNRNTYVVIPNRQIIDSILENHSKQGEIRVDVPVGIAYKEDIDEARAVILKALDEIEHRSEGRAPDVVVSELGGSSVNLLVRVWIDDGRHEQPVHFQTVEASKKALDAAGIEIPYPHLQLFFDDVRTPVWEGLEKLRAAGS